MIGLWYLSIDLMKNGRTTQPELDRASRLIRWLEIINHHAEPVPVSDLIRIAKATAGVSEVTLRADLAALCALKGIERRSRGYFGVAGSGTPANCAQRTSGAVFYTRLRRRAEEKIAIARIAAEAVAADPDLRVVLLDAGSTAYYVAEILSEQPGLDIVVWTPNLAAAGVLTGTPGISVRLLGGEVQADYAAVAGDETAAALRRLAGVSDSELPDFFAGACCVLDINALLPGGLLCTDESSERQQKQLMLRLAGAILVTADRSKLLGSHLGAGVHEICRLQDLGPPKSFRLITSSPLTGEVKQELSEMFCQAFGRFSVIEAEGAESWIASSQTGTASCVE